MRMTLEGAEFAAKIAGAGAKQVAILLYAILRDQKKTKGKTRLTNMLRSGKELKVFAVKDTDLQRFCMEAKKYGVLYCVLKDKSATDGSRKERKRSWMNCWPRPRMPLPRRGTSPQTLRRRGRKGPVSPRLSQSPKSKPGRVSLRRPPSEAGPLCGRS